jgi:hypothetical protein
MLRMVADAPTYRQCHCRLNANKSAFAPAVTVLLSGGSTAFVH